MTVLKSIVLCLALANSGYFLWVHGIAPSQAVPSVAPPPTLKLASEATEAPPPADAATPPSGGGQGGAPLGSTPPGDAPSDTTSPALLTSVQRCLTVGPFKDVSEASHAASTLRGSGYDPRQRVVDGEVWAGVWVYLPLPVNRAPSEQTLNKLKAAGIDDALEMPGPNDASVISLGLFSEQKRAQARVAQVQALGLNPGIADRKRNGNVYWIDIDLKPTDAPLDPANLRGEAGHISRLEVKACPSAVAAQS